MTQNPVRWFEIYVQDMNRARRFYESVFHVQLQRLNTPGFEMWSFPMQMNQMGTAGSLVKKDGVLSGGNSTIVYFACADCAVEEALVPVYGGKVELSKASIGPYGYVSMVLDTEGNRIGLHSME